VRKLDIRFEGARIGIASAPGNSRHRREIVVEEEKKRERTGLPVSLRKLFYVTNASQQ